MKHQILYFKRGWIDATESEDIYQCVGIHPLTLELLDTEELYYHEDLPDLSWGIDNLNDVIDRFLDKKWKLL